MNTLLCFAANHLLASFLVFQPFGKTFPDLGEHGESVPRSEVGRTNPGPPEFSCFHIIFRIFSWVLIHARSESGAWRAHSFLGGFRGAW